MEHKSESGTELSEELDTFRQQWKEELKNSANNSPATTRAGSPAPPKNRPSKRPEAESQEHDKINKAKTSFLKGVEYEQAGNTSAALVFYRQALRLVPDIESYISDYEDYPETGNDTSQEEDKGNMLLEESSLSDFVEEFQKLAVEDRNKICQPQISMRETHISSLPVEVLLYIFKWVVSSEVDMVSLERLSMVCKGFYALARDSDIWRVASLRTWGLKCRETAPDSWNGCWRTMFINRPRLQCNGVYISKCAYVKQGDNSCTFGKSYPLYQVVEYYRYFRFFMDGYVLTLTTADEPGVVVPHLKNRHQCNISCVSLGVYSVTDNKVNVIIEKKEYEFPRSRRRVQQPTTVNTFNMELCITNTKKKRNAKLEWNQYTCHTYHRSTRQSMVSQFDLTRQFTPFFFSRVKSFTDYSCAPL